MRRAALALSAMLSACASTRATAETPLGEIPCLASPFSADATLASLQQALGAENVVEQTFETEGDPITLAVIYPHDETRRMEIAWRDEANRRGIDKIGITAGSRLAGPQDLAVGSSVADAERLNGRPFDVRGFLWDFGGNVADWRGGRLAHANACRVNVSFVVADAAARRLWPDEVVGDRLIASDAPVLRSLEPTVSSITYVYPER